MLSVAAIGEHADRHFRIRDSQEHRREELEEGRDIAAVFDADARLPRPGEVQQFRTTDRRLPRRTQPQRREDDPLPQSRSRDRA